jgi:hypothetical protein
MDQLNREHVTASRLGLSEHRRRRLSSLRRDGPCRLFLQAPDRRECAVIQIDAETLAVGSPHELHAEHARLELDLHLRVWQWLPEWSAAEYVETL